MLLTSIAIAGSGWTSWGPELPESTGRSWRDSAAPMDRVVAFDAIADHRGRLVLATLEAAPTTGGDEPPVAVVAVRRWNGSRWTEDAGWPTRWRSGDWTLAGGDVALAVDLQGRAWVAWQSGPGEISILGEGESEPREIPMRYEADTVELGLDGAEGELTVLAAVPGERGETTELWAALVRERAPWVLVGRGEQLNQHRDQDRLAWTLTSMGPEGHQVTATWPRSIDHPTNRDRAPALLATAEGYRWRTGRTRARPLPTPPGEAGLERLMVKSGNRFLVQPMGEQVSVLRWTGQQWWGLASGRERTGGLGNPDLASMEPWFVPRAPAPTLRWREQRPGRPSSLVEAVWNGSQWVQQRRPTIHHGEPSRPYAVGPKALRRAPEPGPAVCGHQPASQRCSIEAQLHTPSGEILAVTRVVSRDGQRRVVRRGWRILRWTGWDWLLDTDIRRDVPARAVPTLIGTEPPVAVFRQPPRRATAGNVWIYEQRAVGWQRHDRMPHAVTVDPQDTPVAAAHDPDGQLWLAWRQRDARGLNIVVAEHTADGWVRHDALELPHAARDVALDFDRRGRALLAWTDAKGLLVARLARDGWHGLDGPDSVRVWRGSAYTPDLQAMRGRVCVAFSGGAPHEPQVGVFCNTH